MAGSNLWPLLLLGGGTTTSLLMIALLSNPGILNSITSIFTGEGESEASGGGSFVSVDQTTNVYDLASQELKQNGSVSTTTYEMMAQQAKDQSAADLEAARAATAKAEADKRAAESAAAQAEADLQHAKADQQGWQLLATGGGFLGGAAIGAAATSWSGPGMAVGALAGGILGYIASDADGDWWPFW